MKFEKVIDLIEKIAPLDCGENWDNNGVQVNVGNEKIEKILFSLDINDAVIEEAIEKSIDLIVTHHPLLFDRVSRVSAKDIKGSYIIKLIRAGISVYSAHTTFDSAPLGNNKYLAKLFNLKNIGEIENKIGLTGELPYDMTSEELISYVKKKLKLPQNEIRAVIEKEINIRKIAICTGAGGDIIYDAKTLGCQGVITGDVKLNIAQDAKAIGITLIDAGHYGTEKIFAENFKNQMKETLDVMNVNDVELHVAKANTNPYKIW